jgi:hypothetical protein
MQTQPERYWKRAVDRGYVTDAYGNYKVNRQLNSRQLRLLSCVTIRIIMRYSDKL